MIYFYLPPFLVDLICTWIEANDDSANHAFSFAMFVNKSKSGCYVIPAVVEKLGQARSDDIKQIQGLLIDLDNGDIESKLVCLENLGEDRSVNYKYAKRSRSKF